MNNIENKKRYYIICMIFVYIFFILAFRIVGLNYFKGKDLATVAENQYQYKEKKNELNYLLLDYKGRDLLKYKYEYFVVIDPYTYLTNNNYAKKEDIEVIKMLLKNYNKNYDINTKVNTNSASKITWSIDEITYNNLKKIKGVNGIYAYKYSLVDRDNSYWSVENLITNTIRNVNGEPEEKSQDSIEMKLVNKTKNNEYIYNVFEKDVKDRKSVV